MVEYADSCKFLETIRPGGPWVLTSIEPDQKGIETRTFRDTEKVVQWLEVQGATRNIYYHVNPVTRDLDKKAERTEIAALAYLHVDIDPRAGEDIEEEQARALSLLTTNLPDGIPPPTIIVFSGGGYNALWLLREPLVLDGTLEKAEDAKRYNLQLEMRFGADSCHNIDRILRLPGTMNRPNSRKRKKGRKPVVAQLVKYDPSCVYDLSAFTKASAVQEADDGFSGGQVQVSGNVERLSSVDELTVDEWCKVLIVQGENPDEPTKYESRSEALFAVCCEMVREGYDDDAIFSVITDPDFLISSSVLDKGSSTERYAVRQIERAREEAVDPWLRKMNERHAVISNWGGRCRVMEEIHDYAMGRPRLTKQTFDDFKNRYMNQYVVIGVDGKTQDDVKIPLGAWWLKQEHRRQYDTIVFLPGQDVTGSYNLWRGFSCDATPGDCSLYIDHLMKIVCSGDEEHFNYLIGWMATAVQNPGSPGHVAVVLRGRQGTGKSFFARVFGALFGRHFLQVSDSKHLVGSFNAHLRDCVILFGDEAFYAGDKKHESVLKTLITEDTITIEAKGVDAEASSNCVHLIMASNESWVVPIALDDRRFFVLDVSDERTRDGAYFARIYKQMDNGGMEALLHMLLTYDLSDFDVRKAPETEALQEQKEMSLGAEHEWWYTRLREGKLLPNHSDWEETVLTPEMLYDFAQYTKNFSMGRRSNQTKLGRFLRKVCPEGFPLLQQLSGQVAVRQLDGSVTTMHRPYRYQFPPLDECRAYWNENFGGSWDWPEAELIKEEEEHDEF